MKKLKWPGVNKAILNIKIDFSFDEVAVIDTTWEGYLDGYRNAAEILSDLIEKKDHDLAKKDLIAIPLVFLIRHSIELNLKLIIAFCKEKRLFLNDFDFTHNLLESWKTCKRIIELYFDSAPSNDIKNIEKGIKVFNYIDPHSYSLRYPIDKKGNISIPGFPVINILAVNKLGFGICETLVNIFLSLKTIAKTSK